MKCPKCESNNTTVRCGYHTKNGNYRRYRRCLDCQHTFISIEYYVPHKYIGKYKKMRINDNLRLMYYNDQRGILRVKEDILHE